MFANRISGPFHVNFEAETKIDILILTELGGRDHWINV